MTNAVCGPPRAAGGWRAVTQRLPRTAAGAGMQRPRQPARSKSGRLAVASKAADSCCSGLRPAACAAPRRRSRLAAGDRKTCKKYAGNMQEICKKYAKNMQKYAKNMQKIKTQYAKYAAQNMQKICKKYANNMQFMEGLYFAYMQNMHQGLC